MPPAPLISVVIVNWRSARYLPRLFASLAEQEEALEVVVVNNSPEETIPPIPGDSIRLRIITSQHNAGFAKACNQGVEAATGEWIALLNPDTYLAEGCLARLAEALRDQPVWAACPKILAADQPTLLDRAWDGYDRAGTGLTIGHGERDTGQYDEPGEVYGFSGAAVLLRKAVWQSLGGFWPDLFAYYEDVDLNLRAQLAGQRVYYVPAAVAYHHGSATTGSRYNATTIRLTLRNRAWVWKRSLPEPLRSRWGWRFAWRTLLWAGYFALVARQWRAVWQGLREAMNPPAYPASTADDPIQLAQLEAAICQAELANTRSKARRRSQAMEVA